MPRCREDAPAPPPGNLTILGFDPGKNGGVAALRGDSVRAYPMPGTPESLWDLVSGFSPAKTGGPAVAVVELVGGFVPRAPAKRGKMYGQPGSSMFKFGEGYGSLKMSLVAAGIPFRVVAPRSWQKWFGLPTKGGRSTSEWKGLIKQGAAQLFPTARVTLAVADALMIAEYGRQRWRELGFTSAISNGIVGGSPWIPQFGGES